MAKQTKQTETSNVTTGFSPQLKKEPSSIRLFACSFSIWPRFPAKSLSSPNSAREKWMLCTLSKVQFTRVTFPFFFACFLKVEFLVGDCAWDLQCTLILINCFDATIEIWTMKFDAIKAYHLIRNGIMHNNTFTSNWFVSGLVIVYNTWHVFYPSLTGHTNQDGFSTIGTQLFV